MKYWWVNHKQTFNEELSGGYIWSPKANKNGARNQTYINLTLASTGDRIFSYANGEIKAVGIVSHLFEEKQKPSDFGKTGDQWDNNGWLVQVNWTMLSSFVKPKDHISTIAPLLPERNSPIQKNGNGNQSCYLAEISIDLGSRLLAIISNRETAITGVLYDLEKDANENEIEHDIKQLQIAETEKEQIIKSRRGQGTFRINVEKIESGCRITGITDRRFLVASHIKPWRDSDNTERLDGSNGLLLSPHIDKLFDNGWISFSDDGLMLIASNEISDILQAWKIDSNKCVGSFHERQKNYLGYHRKNIYRGT